VNKTPEDIVRVRYRVGAERSQEIIATRKICDKKVTDLTEKHGGSIKFSRVVLASAYPFGAPHV
jgi:hypothetical protein